MSVAAGPVADLPAGDPRPLPANAPLALEDAATAWVVASGRVAVFALRLGDGHPSRRIPLFECGPGEMLIAPPAGAPLALLAVGIAEGTSVQPVPLAELAACAAGSDEDGALAALVEHWLSQLTSCLGEAGPEDGHAVLAGEKVTLGSGEVAWPASGTVWLPSTGLTLFGAEPVAEESLLPLPPRAWISAEAECDLAPIHTAEALVRPEAWLGMECFYAAVLARLGALVELRERAVGDRIARRHAREREERERAYTSLGAVLGEGGERRLGARDGDALLNAMRMVGAAQGIEIVTPPRGAVGASVDPIDAIVRASTVRARTVTLEEGWWRQDAGPLLARRREDGAWVALLPRRGGYEACDPESGTRTRVDDQLARALEDEATMLYRALPSHALDDRDILRFLLRPLAGDLRRVALLAVLIAGISLLTPVVTEHIFSTVVPAKDRSTLVWLTSLLIVFAVASFGFSLVQQLAVLRIQGRASTDLQAALWDRVLDLPLPFFRQHSAGGLTIRVMGIQQIQLTVTTVVVTATLAIPVGIANLALAFVIDPRLAAFGSVALLLFGTGMAILLRYQVPHQRRVREATSNLFGVSMQLVEAVGKLRVADAEERGFVQWGRCFRDLKRSFYDAQLGYALTTSFVAAAPALCTLLLFLGASTLEAGALSGATFVAFNTAFTQALVALTGLTAVATFVAQSVPYYEGTRPILAEPRETDVVRSDPGELRGRIELSHVSLRYAPDAPLVLDDVCLSAEPGELIAVVGPSGAGKSSVMRVLLGFEIPEVGSVRFDGKDLETLDPRALRRQMGVVIQSAKLMPGDVYTNIVGARPLSLEDAWEAAEVAGIAEDIRAMPMGMHTFVSEGAGTFSGGQRQRLLIARAVVGRPRILLFDEATSALDNRTQSEVAGAIEQLRATRIVIAHRLSTIRHADRIVMIDRGQIVQEGGFEELMEIDGPFRRLARRQLA